MLFKTDQIESLQETDLPMAWLTAVNPPNSLHKDKQFVQGVEKTIPLEGNSAV